jgi:hypothetical protein
LIDTGAQIMQIMLSKALSKILHVFCILQLSINWTCVCHAIPLENAEGSEYVDSTDPFLLNARAWIPQQSESGYLFPEEELFTNRSRNGICFSGGGYRSYIASVGYLRALLELGLLDNTRHIVGTSGGSWAVAIYSFGARGGEYAATDAELLGSLVEPENLTLARLRSPIPATSARSAATRR